MSLDTDSESQLKIKSKGILNKAILISSVGNMDRTSTLKVVTLRASHQAKQELLLLQIKNIKTSIASIITNHLLLYPTTEFEKIILVCNTQSSTTAKKGTCIFVEESVDNPLTTTTTNNTATKQTPKLQALVKNDLKNIILQTKNKPKLAQLHNSLQKVLKRIEQKGLFYVVPLNTANKQVNILEQARQIYEAILKDNTNILLNDQPCDFIIDISHGLKWQPLAGYLTSSLITGQLRLARLVKKIESVKYFNVQTNLITTNIYTYIQTAKRDDTSAKNANDNHSNNSSYSTGEVSLIDSITKELGFATATEMLYSQFNVPALLQNAKNILRVNKIAKAKITRYLDDLTNMWEINALFPFDKTAKILVKQLIEHVQNSSAYVNDITEYQIRSIIKFLNYIVPKQSILETLELNNFTPIFLDYLDKRFRLIQLLLNHNAYAKALLFLSEISIDFRIFLILSFNKTHTKKLLEQYLIELFNQINCPDNQIEISRLKLPYLLFQEKAPVIKMLKGCRQGIQVETLRIPLKIINKHKTKQAPGQGKNRFNDSNFSKTKQLVQQIVQKIGESDNNYYKDALTIVEKIIKSKKEIRNYIAHIGYIDIHKLSKFNKLINPQEKNDTLQKVSNLLNIISYIKNEYPAL